MKRYVVWFLRSLVLLLLFLPVLVPSLEREKLDARLKPVVLLAHRDSIPSLTKMAEVEARIKAVFGGKRAVELRTFGGNGVSPVLEFEELGTLIRNAKGIVVVYADPRLWGVAARKFNQSVRETNRFRAGEIHWLNPSSFASEIAGQTGLSAFLVLNDVYVPALSFLGEESRASVEVVGYLAPHAQVRAEVVLRSGESILSSRGIDLEADDTGKIVQVVEIPLSFVKPGTQVLSAQLNNEFAVSPLDIASTTVNVVHAKTTVLHIALGPDFSVRSLRSKLKFWPNLDMVSYYILRDVLSENSIPANQLSLIEFPSAKLFGEQLPNFHGVVIQNFPFGSYLNPEESKNLVEYVKNGGRLLLQAGPLSFSNTSTLISGLYPCKKAPHFDLDNVYSWIPADNSVVGASELFDALRGMESRVTAVGCEPVDGAFVLARTRQGGHPVLISTPVGKGLVVSVLSGDWLSRFAQFPTRDESEKTLRVQGAGASQVLFRWLVEFLQRRQDGGIRPPDLIGPRVFSGDDILMVRSRGVARVNTPIQLNIDGERVVKGSLLWLDFLGMEVARFSAPVGGVGSETIGERSSHYLRLDFPDGASSIRRAGLWPIVNGKSADIWKFHNPLVFDGFGTLREPSHVDKEVRERRARELVPLLEVFPFLLALALGLLALEQYLVHVRWRGKLD